MRIQRLKNHKKRRTNKSSLIKQDLKGFWKKCKKYTLIFGVSFLAFLIIYSSFFLPSVKNAEQLSFSESSIIYDRNALNKLQENPTADISEHILYSIHGEENRDYIPLEQISPYLIDATIAIEDQRFYYHFGFDPLGLANAILGQIGLGQVRGGSTLTQQLVKNTFLTRERTFSRKFKEILLAIKMEWHYSKEEILELYLNKIPYGHNAYGAEAAAQKFFGKSARDLSLAESSILASLPKAPTRYSPFGSNKELLLGYEETNEKTGKKEWKKGRKDLVLGAMLQQKKITFEEFSKAVSESKNLEFTSAKTEIRAPHFVFFVREQIEEKYGKEFLRQGGLQIFTTLDQEIQNAAEEIIAQKSPHYPTTFGATNVALAAIKNETGEILAYIGGKNFFDEENDGQVDVLRSYRQPGSSFKPITAAAAFMKGYSPSTIIFDVLTDFGGNYAPQNYDGNFSGPVTIREAINRSLNIPLVKLGYLAKPSFILAVAEKVGIKFREGAIETSKHELGVSLGQVEVEALSHIASYQVFAGDGSYYQPTSIIEIWDAENNILEKTDFKENKKEGLDSQIAALVRHVLTDETTRPTTDGFDWNRLLQLKNQNNGAKTGTSNDHAPNPDFNPDEPESEENSKTIVVPNDSWTIGFTPHLVTGVWVGNNNGKAMKSGATGLAVAAPIWKAFSQEAHEILIKNGADPQKLYNEPNPLEVRKINKWTNLLSTEKTPEELTIEAFFTAAHTPTEQDPEITTQKIDLTTGQIANENAKSYNTTNAPLLHLNLPQPELPNWQNPINQWLSQHPRFLSSLGQDFSTKEELIEADPLFGLSQSSEAPRTKNTNNQGALYGNIQAPTLQKSTEKNDIKIQDIFIFKKQIVVEAYLKKSTRYHTISILDEKNFIISEKSIIPNTESTQRITIPREEATGPVTIRLHSAGILLDEKPLYLR